MRKNLLTLFVLCIVACCNMIGLKAQTTSCDCAAGVNAGMPVGPADPVYTLGVSSPVDISASFVPGTAETQTPDYTFVVTDPNNLVLGISDDGSFDFGSYPAGTYGFTGFAYDNAQLNTIAGLINSLCAIGGGGIVPPEVCAVVYPLPTPVTLGDFIGLISSFAGGAQPIETVVHTMDSIVCQSSAAGLIAACFSTTIVPAYTVEVVEATGGCNPDAGMPMPTNAVVCNDGSDEASLVAAVPANTGTENYVFVLTQHAADSTILALSPDGVFDINGLELANGTYYVSGFAFNRSDAENLINNCPIVAQLPFICPVAAALLNSAVDQADDTDFINDVLGAVGLLASTPICTPSEVSLSSVITGLTTVGGFCPTTPLCFDISIGAYTITVQDCAPPGCSADECIDACPIDLNIPFHGPFDNTNATVAPDELPQEFADICFFGDGAGHTQWFSFVGDGGTYHISANANCGNPDIDLIGEGTYITGGDTEMLLFMGSACDGLTPVDCNEDDFAYGAGSNNFFAGITVQTEPGETYYLWIDGYDTAVGQYCIEIISEPCGNVDFVAAPTALSICPTESVSLSIDESTLALGATVGQAVLIISDGQFGTQAFQNYAIGAPTITLNGNAEGLFAFTNQAQTEVTLSCIFVQLAILSETGGIDLNCLGNTSDAYQICFLPEGDAACSGGCDAAPANDECAGAILLDISNGAMNGPFTNTCATGEAGLVAPDCFADPTGVYENSVWFMFEGTGATVTLTTDAANTTTPVEGNDTQLAVFEMGCNGLEVACSDDIDFDNDIYNSQVTFATQAGMMYYVVVDGFSDPIYQGGVSDGEFFIYATQEVSGVSFVDVGTNIDEVTNSYIATFTVEGGIQPYDFSGSFVDVFDFGGGIYFSAPIECGVDATFVVTDASGSTANVLVSSPCSAIEPLTIIVLGSTVSPDETTYTYTFAVTGGISPYDLSSSNAAVTDNGDGTYTTAPIACGTDFIASVTDSQGANAGQVLPAACQIVVDCEANYGMVMAPGNTLVCAGGTNAAVAVMDDNTNGYTTTFALTNGPSGGYEILNLSSDGTFDFSGLSAGDYIVHAFNFSNADQDAILNAVANGATGLDVFGLISSGTICAALDVTGVTFTLLDPIVVDYDPDCNNLTGELFINVTVSGGIPGAVYTYAGATNSTSDDIGTSFTLGPFTDGFNFTLTASDGLCESSVDEPGIACVKCDYLPGSMPEDGLSFCLGFGSGLSLPGALGYELLDVAVLTYVLEGNGITLYDTNEGDGTADFSWANLTAGTYNVYALVGEDEDGDDLPDMTNACTVASNELTVTISSGITLHIDEECNYQTGKSTLIFSVTGGQAPYSVTGGSLNLTLQAGQTESVGDIENATYDFTATDASGCTDAQQISLECLKNPVTWLSFNGSVKTEGNLLTWATASETNNHYFSVERSQDGEHFTSIGRVNGSGTTLTESNYQFLDKTAPKGLSYYRLVQVDFDGKSDASTTISLRRSSTGFGINSLSPIPAFNTLQISYNSDIAGDMSLQVFDATGKLLQSQNLAATAGANNTEIQVANYAAGLYFITLNNGIETLTAKFTKH